MGKSFLQRFPLFAIVFSLFCGVPLRTFALDFTYSVLIDTDDNRSTGCVVSLSGQNQTGIERRLSATVSDATFQVTQVELQSCDTGTGLFGPPTALASGYPVALSQGLNGSDAVEFAVATTQIGTAGGRPVFVAEKPGCLDVLDGSQLPPVPIPTLSGWAAIFLLLGLLIGGALAIRQRGFKRLPGLLLLGLSGIGLAAGFAADGSLNDWAGVSPVQNDATGDSTCSQADVDIVAGFAAEEGSNLFYRMDIRDMQPPTAVNDSYAVGGSGGIIFQGNNIVSTGTGVIISNPVQGLLGNDTDPENDTLQIHGYDNIGTSGGSVSVNPDGTFSYTAPAPGPATDTFTYRVRDPGGLVDTGTVTITLGGTLFTDGGSPITVSHVRSGASGTNVGTFENPFNALPATQGTDIVYVHADSSFTGQSYTLSAGQRFLGEGDGAVHTLNTDQGQITLPAGSGGTNRPVIDNAPGNAITSTGSEIKNFRIGNPNAGGIFLNNVGGQVTVERIIITNGFWGVEVANSNGLTQFMDVDISNSTGANVLFNGGSGNSSFDANSRLDQAGTGDAVQIVGGHSGQIDFNGPINVTNGDGLQFNNADGIYNFNGQVTLSGGNAGIDIIGGSAGTFTFANTDITFNGTGDAVNVDNHTAGVVNFQAASSLNATSGDGLRFNSAAGTYNFTGPATISSATAGIDIIGGTGTFTFTDVDITHSGGGSTLDVDNHTTGSVNFQAASNFNVTNGDGLQFNNADGTYNFNGQITLNGGDAGIDILGGSAGTFTFTNTDITYNGTGSGVNIDNHATGTVNFQAASGFNITNGDGLQFNDADGIYNFNGPVTLGGGNAGIDILGDSDGTFTFAGTTSITNNTGLALNIDGGVGGQDAQVNFTGFLDIDQSVGAGVIANNSGLLNIQSSDIDNTTGDGINVANTSLTLNFIMLGTFGSIGDDGIEIVNNDAVARNVLVQNSNIGLGTAVANRGIFIDSSGSGTLSANLCCTAINATNQTIFTQDGGSAASLLLDLQGNSTLTTDSAGVFTEEHRGSGLNSTIVRSWQAPNQVVGSVGGTGSSGILFDRITFDASGTSLSGTQVVFGGNGVLTIGASVARVKGDGLSFINPTGDLSIPTLDVFNDGGTGLEVDTKGLGTTFNLVTGGGTIDTIGGPATFLDPLTGDITLERIDVAGSPSNGIIVDVFAGSFRVTGDGTPGSGGSIRGTSDTPVLLKDAATVELAGMSIFTAAEANPSTQAQAFTLENSVLSLANTQIDGTEIAPGQTPQAHGHFRLDESSSLSLY